MTTVNNAVSNSNLNQSETIIRLLVEPEKKKSSGHKPYDIVYIIDNPQGTLHIVDEKAYTNHNTDYRNVADVVYRPEAALRVDSNVNEIYGVKLKKCHKEIHKENFKENLRRAARQLILHGLNRCSLSTQLQYEPKWLKVTAVPIPSHSHEYYKRHLPDSRMSRSVLKELFSSVNPMSSNLNMQSNTSLVTFSDTELKMMLGDRSSMDINRICTDKLKRLKELKSKPSLLAYSSSVEDGLSYVCDTPGRCESDSKLIQIVHGSKQDTPSRQDIKNMVELSNEGLIQKIVSMDLCDNAEDSGSLPSSSTSPDTKASDSKASNSKASDSKASDSTASPDIHFLVHSQGIPLYKLVNGSSKQLAYLNKLVCNSCTPEELHQYILHLQYNLMQFVHKAMLQDHESHLTRNISKLITIDNIVFARPLSSVNIDSDIGLRLITCFPNNKLTDIKECDFGIFDYSESVYKFTEALSSAFIQISKVCSTFKTMVMAERTLRCNTDVMGHYHTDFKTIIQLESDKKELEAARASLIKQMSNSKVDEKNQKELMRLYRLLMYPRFRNKEVDIYDEIKKTTVKMLKQREAQEAANGNSSGA